MPAESKSQVFPAHSLPVASVTVFDDRAEVARTIKTSLKSGINEICVQNISKSALENCIKVTPRGNAIVKEVNFHETAALESDENQSPRLKALLDERKTLINEQKKQVDSEELLKKEVEVLDKMVCEAGSEVAKSSDDQESVSLTVEDEDLNGFSSFLEFYMNLSLEKRESLHQCESLKKQIDEKLNKVNSEIQQLQNSRMFTRNVTIVLEAAEECDIELDISYQVWQARWFPSYDIRLVEDETDHNLMKITYYGKIVQKTGEDWLDAPIILSTAKPILGGNIPELGTLCAKFYVPMKPVPFRGPPMTFGVASLKCAKLKSRSLRDEGSAVEESMVNEADEAPLAPALATSSDAALSTTFKISRPTTIFSGSGEHKVVITVLELHPIIFYQTVPCKDKNVYIVSSASNTSSFPFLAGETSIYVNNSFVSKSSMKNISPGEKFQCVLGVDPAIAVEYKPAGSFSEQVGVISKSTSKTHEQKIVVRSSKQTKIMLTIRELVPKSTDEKIKHFKTTVMLVLLLFLLLLKIRLFSPELSQKQGTEDVTDTAIPTEGAKLDKDHNLEWTFNVEPNSNVEKVVKWTVEYPALESIVIVETPLQHMDANTSDVNQTEKAVHNFKVFDLPISLVTVYTDRAEIKRLVRVDLKPGINEVIVEAVSKKTLADSIRVDGHGEATIHEVQFQCKPALTSEAPSPKVKSLQTELKNLNETKSMTEDRQNVIQKQVEALDLLITKATSCVAGKGKKVIFNDITFGSIRKLLDYYESKSIKLREQSREISDEIVELSQKIEKLEAELENIQNDIGNKRDISIVLEAKKNITAELFVSYQVWDAHWMPSYDIHVSPGEDAKAIVERIYFYLGLFSLLKFTQYTANSHLLKMMYYGKIEQSSGEDWNEAKLILSTAQPALGGRLPTLGRLEAKFSRPVVAVQRANGIMSNGFSAGGLFGAARPAADACMPVSKTVVSDSEMSTVFEITRLTTIPSDSSAHRVTIAVVKLNAALLHTVVPSKNTNVFLLASLINESAYPFLAGEASVYFSNSFIAKTCLKSVAPGEFFECSLGVDAAIKIDCKPMATYTEQVGFISKNPCVAHERKILAKNTKNEDVTLTLKEAIPKSTDEKIKIRLISPSVSEMHAEVPTKKSLGLPALGAILNDQKQLEWTVKLKPNEETELIIKYSVEYPSNEKVVFEEVF
uniref:DUF4139 domain-containing protein n=1 Tax=Syphacia muris TaxID=451379 RepID=A0A158R5R4_9BILA